MLGHSLAVASASISVRLANAAKQVAVKALEIAAGFLAAEINEDPKVRDYLAAQIALLIVRGEKNPIGLANHAIDKFTKHSATMKSATNEAAN